VYGDAGFEGARGCGWGVWEDDGLDAGGVLNSEDGVDFGLCLEFVDGDLGWCEVGVLISEEFEVDCSVVQAVCVSGDC